MNETKTIKVLLNGKYPADFTLELSINEEGERSGFLTCPYVKWLTPEENDIYIRTFTITGETLDCIEKYYFDANEIYHYVKGYPYEIEIEKVVLKILPPKILKQMLKGTFKERPPNKS